MFVMGFEYIESEDISANDEANGFDRDGRRRKTLWRRRWIGAAAIAFDHDSVSVKGRKKWKSMEKKIRLSDVWILRRLQSTAAGFRSEAICEAFFLRATSQTSDHAEERSAEDRISEKTGFWLCSSGMHGPALKLGWTHRFRKACIHRALQLDTPAGE